MPLSAAEQGKMLPQDVELLLYQLDLELGRLNQNTDVLRAPLISVSEPAVESNIAHIKNLLTLGLDKTLFIPAHCNGHYFYLSRENRQWGIHDSFPLGNQKTPLQELMQKNSEVILREITGDKTLTCGFQSSETQKETGDNYSTATHVTNAYGSQLVANYTKKTHAKHMDIILFLQKKAKTQAEGLDAPGAVMMEVPLTEEKVKTQEKSEKSLLRANPFADARYGINDRQRFFQSARNLYENVDKPTLDLLSKSDEAVEEDSKELGAEKIKTERKM